MPTQVVSVFFPRKLVPPILVTKMLLQPSKTGSVGHFYFGFLLPNPKGYNRSNSKGKREKRGKDHILVKEKWTWSRIWKTVNAAKVLAWTHATNSWKENWLREREGFQPAFACHLLVWSFFFSRLVHVFHINHKSATVWVRSLLIRRRHYSPG